jgi:hypothetical protein
MLIDEYDKIIICHYGKIGSVTLTSSLEKLLNIKAEKIKRNLYYNSKILVAGFGTLKHCINNYKDLKVLIITVCRNLIERQLSLNFQLHGEDYVNKINNNILTLQDVLNISNNRINKSFKTIDRSFTVFNDLLNIDIYKTFDFNNKYKLFKSNNFHLLFLRFEDINHWENIFYNIWSCNIKLVNYNNIQLNKNIFFDEKPYLFNIRNKELSKSRTTMIKLKSYFNNIYNKVS